MKNKKGTINAIITAAALILVVFVMFMGKADSYIDDGALHMSISMGGSATVPLSEITGLELRESFEAGKRVVGIGSVKLAGGKFSNGEFGNYQLYSYSSVSYMIVVKTADGIYCFNKATNEETAQFYRELADAAGLQK